MKLTYNANRGRTKWTAKLKSRVNQYIDFKTAVNAAEARKLCPGKLIGKMSKKELAARTQSEVDQNTTTKLLVN